jgi:RNA polymerase sigma factor (sigma-70 family)
MSYSKQVEMFRQARTKYMGFLSAVLWKLTGDRELFTEAMQYSLLEMWRHVDKLDSEKAGAYIYKIALTANSKAWRNRIGSNGEISEDQISAIKNPSDKAGESEMAEIVRRAIAGLSDKQGQAIVMRYFEQKDYDVIAKDLRCSPAGARSHVSKALAALKGKLAGLAEGMC